MQKLFGVIKKCVSAVIHFPHLVGQAYHFALFFILLISFLIIKTYTLLTRVPLVGRLIFAAGLICGKVLGPFYRRVLSFIDRNALSEVNRSYLIEVGYKNLMSKRTRSIVTILGMSVGMGVIVLLLSLGYGIERLIINRVAGLDELRIVDVSTGENTALRLNAKSYAKIKKITGVTDALPIISVVGRISYNKATTDVLVYAASKEYVDLTKLKLKKGKLFASYLLDKPIENVSGVSSHISEASLGSPASQGYITFDVVPDVQVPVWSACTVKSEIRGYVSRLQGGYKGTEYWGSLSETADYQNVVIDKNTHTYLGKWVKAEVPLYESPDGQNIQPKLDKQGKPVYETVCIQQKYIQKIGQYAFADVLGESTAAASLAEGFVDQAQSVLATEVVASTEGQLEFVSVQASPSATTKTASKEKLKFKDSPSRTALVSLGLIKLLNIPESSAVGTAFNVSYIISKSLYPEIEGKAFTEEQPYKIAGIIDDEESQYFYIPFADMQQLGLKNYSQLKVVVNDKNSLGKVRKQIETYGYKTASTSDTVSQIESLFSNLRVVLVLLGMVALGVASLGMFNTLTVSLLERTREIGGMKTMGMISNEVQDLFLAEAMIMGLSGGIGGVTLGFLSGKIISFLVSIIAISRGQGYLELAYVPPYLVAVIIVFSFIVGVLTGIYPAQRAKKISALNALRYE
jgi:ABC-type lipoprotein release transport system permease subunit